MSELYRIKNWDSFENNRTRKMKQMLWIPVPNKHDGDGYTELVDREDGAAMLGAWLAILQVASKCSVRGTLLRDNGNPHSPKTISRLTRLKEDVISQALELLLSDEIGWLEVVDTAVLAGGRALTSPIARPTDEEEKEENRIEEKEGVEGTGPYDEMIDEVIACRPEFRNVSRDALRQVIHNAESNPLLKQNHDQFIANMANEITPPNNPPRAYGGYLQSSGKPQKRGHEDFREKKYE